MSSYRYASHAYRPPARKQMLGYPYQNGFDGYHVDRHEDRDDAAKPWAFTASVEGAYLYKGVYRGGVNVRAAFHFLEIDSRTSFLLEAPAETPQDAMYLGDAGLWLVPARLRHWTLRIGGGARYMIDGRTPGQGRREYALGWNVGGGFDFFPVKPLVVSGRVDGGKLWHATIIQARATVGVAIKRVEIFAGYDHLQIGTVALGGPLAGLRAWF